MGGGGALAKESFCDDSWKQTTSRPEACHGTDKFTGHWFHACVSHTENNAEQEHFQSTERPEI